jgi:HTH-type transcriptional regulator, sugar sensing transcriptional regulator
MIEESEGQALLELGLTNRQAKVFLALLRYETSTARALSLSSSLARQDTYNVLDELQKIGLVTKLLSAPTKFAAIPIKDAYSILLNRKIRQTSDLETRTRKLIKRHESQVIRANENEEPKILIIPGREAFVLTLKKAIKNSRKTIDIASSGKNLPQGIISLIEDLEKAVSRGVKIRCLTDMDANKETQRGFDSLKRSNSFEVRTIKKLSWARFCIYDKKELSIIISPLDDYCKSSILGTNCPSMVDAYLNHYETMWLNANCDSNWKNGNAKLTT